MLLFLTLPLLSRRKGSRGGGGELNNLNLTKEKSTVSHDNFGLAEIIM